MIMVLKSGTLPSLLYKFWSRIPGSAEHHCAKMGNRANYRLRFVLLGCIDGVLEKALLIPTELTRSS